MIGLNEVSGRVIDIAAENVPVAGCTVSNEVAARGDFHLSYFSLAKNTDISAESYQLPRLLYVVAGELTVYSPGRAGAPTRRGVPATVLPAGTPVAMLARECRLGPGEATLPREWRVGPGVVMLLPTGVPVGMKTSTGTVYVEFCFEEATTMNELIKAGEVFKLKELLPYQPGKIVSMDIIHDEHLKFALMSFAGGTGLTEHAAPGEALVFALDGTGIIGYEGQEYELKAGETFKFAKNGRHYVKAKGDFKMALLLMFEN